MVMGFGQVGLTEVLLIVAVIVLVFGASQIPKIAKSLGEGLREFKKAVREAKDEDKDKTDSGDKQKKE